MNPEENPTNKEENKTGERTPIKSLRTYQGDVQEAIEKNKYSGTTILVAEQKRKLDNPTDYVNKEGFKFRNKTFVLVGTTLIVLGLATIAVFYYIKSNEKIVIEKRTKALIAFSNEEIISLKNLDRAEIVNKIVENKTTWNSAVNSVLYLNILSNTKELGISEVLSIVAPNMAPSLVRSFGDKYMFGIYSFDTNEVFIILTVDDFSLAYPGMLRWEKDMETDLGGIFEVTREASTTPRLFTDLSSKNRDIRILKDTTGNSLMLYSFIDRKTLVITKNENILSAVVDKILVSKQTK